MPLPTSRHGGGAQAGFELRTRKADRVVHIRVWGFWDHALADVYRHELLACFAELGSGGFRVLLDNRQSPAQRPEVAKVRTELMHRAVELGLTRIAAMVASPSSEMQLRRLASEGTVPRIDFFGSEAEAEAALRG